MSLADLIPYLVVAILDKFVPPIPDAFDLETRNRIPAY